MAIEFSLDMPTKGLDDLLSSREQRENDALEKVRIVPFDLIDDFPGHPFKVRIDDEMQKMIESVKEHGILVPLLLRPKPDGRYELVSGHRRKFAGQAVDLPGVSAVVRDMDDDTATIIMVDSNLQREKVLASEKAFAYKMKMEAMKRQGKRTDLTSCQVGTKLEGERTDVALAEKTEDSARQIQRYIRLTELIPPILSMVDDEQIKFNPAVEISHLPAEKQEFLYEVMDADECTPSHAQAIKMKQLDQEGNLSNDAIMTIMAEEKGNQIEQFKIPRDSITRFFAPNTKKEEIQATIVKALELYTKQQSREQDREGFVERER